MGLMLPSRRLLARGAPWWRRSEHLLDGVAPGLFVDIAGRRYVVGGAAVALASVLGITSGAGKTYCDADGSLKTANANEARIDWRNGAAELLLEGSATNLCTYSTDPTNAAWALIGTTKTAGQADLFGGTSAALISTTAVAAQAAIVPGSSVVSYVSGTTYTASCFLRAGTQSLVQLILPNPQFSGVYVNFDLATGTVGTASGATGTISAHRNGFYRVSITAACTTTGTSYALGVAFVTSLSSSRFPTVTLSSDFYIMGPQIEAGAVATSYIPTTGAAATRATDLCQLTAGAAAAIQGASAAVAWRGTIPVAQSGQQIVGLGDGLNLIRATTTPNTRVAIFNATSGLALGVGTDVIPGALGLCAGWGASGARLAVNGTAASAAQTNAWPTTVYLGASSGLSTGQVLRLRQLVGWALTDQPSAAGAILQARLAA